MALTVLLVGYPFAPVGPDAVGGAEQVVSLLDEALVTAGHRSLVVAPEGSRVRGTLFPTPAWTGPLDDVREAAWGAVRDAVGRALAEARVDVVHLHGVDFHATLPPPGIPTLVTLHLPAGFYPEHALSRRDVVYACVSHAQRRTFPDALGAVVLDNGVRLDRFRVGGVGEHALCLGRICPEKGFHLAVDAAVRAGVPLRIAGAVFRYAAHEDYFARELAPRLDADRRYVGPADVRARRELLSEARCLLVPSQVDETSSLVAMEALASGTPVIAFRRGALVDVVDHGRTGFLVDDVDGMARAIRAVDTLEPAVCRREAEARFSSEVATGRTLALYASLRRRSGSGVRVDVVPPDALADEWARLWDADPRASVFQRPEWLVPWARRFAPDTARCVTLRRGGRLVGLLPFFTYGDRQVALLGAGPTDRLDALLAPDAGPGVAARLLEAALHGASSCALDELPEGSALLAAAAPAGWTDEIAVQSVSPVVALPDTPSGLPDRLARSVRRNVSQGRRRAARAGDVRVDTAHDTDVAVVLDALFALHSERWRARGEPGVVADEGIRAFYRAAAEGLDRAGMLRLYAWRLDGRIRGAWWGMSARGRLSYYLGGFDPALAPLCVGQQLLAHAAERGIEAGCRELDLLRGAEPYKYRWGARDRVQRRRVLGRNG